MIQNNTYTFSVYYEYKCIVTQCDKFVGTLHLFIWILLVGKTSA